MFWRPKFIIKGGSESLNPYFTPPPPHTRTHRHHQLYLLATLQPAPQSATPAHPPNAPPTATALTPRPFIEAGPHKPKLSTDESNRSSVVWEQFGRFQPVMFEIN